jgi:hypothetical protein
MPALSGAHNGSDTPIANDQVMIWSRQVKPSWSHWLSRIGNDNFHSAASLQDLGKVTASFEHVNHGQKRRRKVRWQSLNHSAQALDATGGTAENDNSAERSI